MDNKSIVKEIDRIMNDISKTSQKLDKGEFKTEVDRIWIKLYNLVGDIEYDESVQAIV